MRRSVSYTHLDVYKRQDYISKPFRPRELISRIRSVLRRCGKTQPIVEIGDLRVDTVRASVTKGGADCCLSALEYRLLLFFLNHRGMVLTRGQLLEEIWDAAGEFVNDNTLTVYIKRLREKIETDPQNPTIIRTVRGPVSYTHLDVYKRQAPSPTPRAPLLHRPVILHSRCCTRCV